MGVRELCVATLAFGLSACLVAPPPDRDRDAPPIGSDPDGGALPDGGAPSDATAACADSFAVAYTSGLDVRPDGGAFTGVLVVTAIGDGVDLSQMVDDGDDSVRLELELAKPNYDPMAPGVAKGELDVASAALIIDQLVASEDWTEPASPTFQLTFTPLEDVAPPPHTARARLRVGGSVATLRFDLTYDGEQAEVAIPRKATMAWSVCGG